MSGTVKTLLIVAAAAVLLFLFRVSVCTIYTIPDNTLAPAVKQGDRVLVNRWSYGLRVGGNDWISYCRIARKTVEKGDFIAFDAPVSSAAKRAVMMGRVVAVPGDTVKIDGQMYVIPRGCQVCTCGCMSSCIVNPNQHGGDMLVAERDIIGRATSVIYNFNNYYFDNSRWFLPIRRHQPFFPPLISVRYNGIRNSTGISPV